MINEGTLNWYSHLHEGIASKHGSMQMALSSNISHIYHSIDLFTIGFFSQVGRIMRNLP